ncbi:MAG TPA: hypothetical protein VJZ27_12805, partial [Aggregatilineales bacterium]|nr:hypothetical protein [Aggregatilineales bacterium]
LNRASSKRAALESELSQFGTIIPDTSPENLATQAAADGSLPIVPPPVIEQPAPGFLPTVTPAPVLSATPPPLPPPTATITIAPIMPPLPPPTATDYRFFQSSPTPQ